MGIVVWPEEPYLNFKQICLESHSKTPTREFLDRNRFMDSSIYILMVQDPESVPGNILSEDKGSSKHTVYFLKTKAPEIIPGNILSEDKGS